MITAFSFFLLHYDKDEWDDDKNNYTQSGRENNKEKQKVT